MNYQLNRVIGFDETGFRGSADWPYNADAWDFLIAGGAVYEQPGLLVRTPDAESGTAIPNAPGGGGANLR